MAREVMKWTTPIVRIALTEGGLATGAQMECQITSAELQPQPQYQTIPATGCAPAAQSPGRTGWQLVLNWLQDWSKPADESLSRFLFDHDGEEVWVELEPVAGDATVGAVVHTFAVSGGFGGTFGDGSVAATTATMPALDTPDITSPAAIP